MIERVCECVRQPSLWQYLTLIIVSIILLVTGVLLAISYSQAEDVVLKLDEYFQEYTELNIRERVSLVDAGLSLYDSGLNGQLKQAFIPYFDEYRLHDGNLSAIDYSGLQKSIGRNISGVVDLYVINRSGIIIQSTVPEVLSLNLSQNIDYCVQIPRIMDGNEFAADRVVRSYSSADAPDMSGKLRKFGFMPTPDHRYVLEIGVSDLSFSDMRGNLSYYLVSDEMSDINPYLDNIRIFDIHKNLFVKGGIIPPDSLDSVTRSRLDEVITTRSDKTYYDRDENQRTRYLFISLDNGESLSDMSVIVEVIYSDSLLEDEMSRLVSFFSGVGCIAVFLGLALTLWASRIITRPISDIVEDVDQIAKGDLNHRIRCMEVKEFSHLIKSINLMINKIRTATEEIQRRTTELTIAADIQKSFLPEVIPSISGFDIDARNIPVKEVGGDFYDVIPYTTGQEESGKYGILIADVSGKGVPAALFMALSRTIIRVTAKDRIPADSLFDANNFITADSRSGMFVSLFYLLISEGKSPVTYVNAGHNPPVYYQAQTRSATLLHEGGIVLGIADSFRFQEEEMDLKTGDIIVLYTDGVTEAINADTEMYGEGRLCRVVEQHAEKSAVQILDAVLEDLRVFTGNQAQFDDITILVIKKI